MPVVYRACWCNNKYLPISISIPINRHLYIAVPEESTHSNYAWCHDSQFNAKHGGIIRTCAH